MHGGEAHRSEAKVPTCSVERLPHGDGLVAGDEQLEAELTHVGDAQRRDPGVPDFDLTRGEVGEGFLGEVVRAHPLQEFA